MSSISGIIFQSSPTSAVLSTCILVVYGLPSVIFLHKIVLLSSTSFSCTCAISLARPSQAIGFLHQVTSCIPRWTSLPMSSRNSLPLSNDNLTRAGVLSRTCPNSTKGRLYSWQTQPKKLVLPPRLNELQYHH